MITMKSVALVLVICLTSAAIGSEQNGKGFRTKSLRRHKENPSVLSSLGSAGGDISVSGPDGGSFAADITGAGEQGAKFAEAGLTSIKEGGDQVKENVEAAAKAFIDAFLQTFKEGIQDLKLALDDHYSSNSGNVKFNFKHTSENNNNGDWKTNTISCTSGLSSSPVPVTGGAEEDEGYFKDEFSARRRNKGKLGLTGNRKFSLDTEDESESSFGQGKFSLGVGRLSADRDIESESSGKGKFSFDVRSSAAEESESSSKGKFGFGLSSDRDSDSSGRGKFSIGFGSSSGGDAETASSGKGKFSLAIDNSESSTTGSSGHGLSFGIGGRSDFSERRAKIDNEFTAKSRSDVDSESTGQSGGRFGFSVKSSGSGGNSGSYSARADSDESPSGGFGISGTSSSSSSDGGGSLGSKGKTGAKISLGGSSSTGGAAKFSLGRLRRGRPISRIDYAIQDERPWRDYILKYPESPYTHSYGSHSIAPTYVNYPHN